MEKYKTYSINNDDCDNPSQWKNILSILLDYSDMFSLIYFRYDEGEKVKAGVKKIKKGLEKMKVSSKRVSAWPGTIVFTESKVSQSHVYQMILYHSTPDAFPVLSMVGSLWEWNYSAYPMDPCFYKNGRCIFYATTHEGYNTLILSKEDQLLLQKLENAGVDVHYVEETTDFDLFFLDKNVSPLQRTEISGNSLNPENEPCSLKYIVQLIQCNEVEKIFSILTAYSDYFCISFDKKNMNMPGFSLWEPILQTLEADLVDETLETDEKGVLIQSYFYLNSMHCWEAMKACDFFNFLIVNELDGIINFYHEGCIWADVECTSKVVNLLTGGAFLSARDIESIGVELVPAK